MAVRQSSSVNAIYLPCRSLRVSPIAGERDIPRHKARRSS